jgi:hypothetical protein
MANATARVSHLLAPRQRLESAIGIAREHAADVDQNSRFPRESFAALKMA